MRVAIAPIFSVTLAIAAACGAAHAQDAADSNEARIEDLITASHILANEGILDSFGHATVRSVTDPTHFFMPRAMPPALVSRAEADKVFDRLVASKKAEGYWDVGSPPPAAAPIIE